MVRQPRDRLAAEAIASSLNLLSLIFARVYFPSYSNGLKENARFLGFEWSDTTADGLHAIVCVIYGKNRPIRNYEKKLITYNKEDCAALGVMTRVLGRLSENPNANETQPLQTGVVRADAIRPTGKWGPFKVQFLIWKKSTGQLDGIIKEIGFSYDREEQGDYRSNQHRERWPRKHKRSFL